MSRALLPGSYDPITVGHLDIIERCAKQFDEVVVLISRNPSKNYMLCSEKRAVLARDAVENLKNVFVEVYDGLLVDFAHTHAIDVTVKGIRNEQDFAYEQNMAKTNMLLSEKIYSKPFETLLMPCDDKYSSVSSSAVRLLLSKGADVSSLVPNEKLLSELLK